VLLLAAVLPVGHQPAIHHGQSAQQSHAESHTFTTSGRKQRNDNSGKPTRTCISEESLKRTLDRNVCLRSADASLYIRTEVVNRVAFGSYGARTSSLIKVPFRKGSALFPASIDATVAPRPPPAPRQPVQRLPVYRVHARAASSSAAPPKEEGFLPDCLSFPLGYIISCGSLASLGERHNSPPFMPLI
jgi:hypothetical protein